MFPTIDRLGVRNFAGTQPTTTTAEFELFKKQYLVDIVTRFKYKLIIASRVMKKQIPNGTGASFPLTGKTTARFYVPSVSDELDGHDGLPQAEKTINLDRPIISDIAVSNVDELMAHYSVDSTRSEEQGEALAKKADLNVAQLLILTSRATPLVTGASAGGAITAANMDTDATVLAKSIKNAVARLAALDVPVDPDKITAVVRPTQYFNLLESDLCIDMDYIASGHGDSPFRTGKVPSIAGCPVEWSNSIPSTNISTAEAGALNTYNGDFSKSQGVVWHKGAVGTVQLLDIMFEADYQARKQNTVFIARMMTGNGYLRPEAAVELALP